MKIIQKYLLMVGLITPFLIHADKVRIYTYETKNPEKHSENVAYIHCHGKGANYEHAFYYQRQGIVHSPLITFDFPDARENGEHDHQKSNLGQQEDVASLAAAYKHAQEKFPHHSFVGQGVSRGAVTWLNFCALHKPEKIRGLIIESPFDDILTIVQNRIRYIPGSEFLARKLGPTLLKKFFPAWDPQGYKPIDLVEKIPHTIPMLFIHSDQDDLIPHKSSENLSQKLAQSGHEVYCLILKGGGQHANILHASQGDLYKNVVNAFYKKLGLPHDAKRAQEGADLLEQCKVVKK